MAKHCQTCGQTLNYDEEKAGDDICDWCDEQHSKVEG